MANEVRPCEFPRRLLVPFPRGKGTRPAGRNPLRRSRRHSMIVPSSVWPGGQPPFPIPSGLRPSSLPLLAFGHFPLTGGIGPLTRGVGPQGEGFRSAGGENLRRTARLLELQEAKRSFAENFFASFLFQRKEVLLPTFLARKVGQAWAEARVRGSAASWAGTSRAAFSCLAMPLALASMSLIRFSWLILVALAS